jgi:Fungal specific transcription factor domain
MELPKPSLAWKLIASAARLALDLGIHRQPVGSTGPAARRERLLFWFVYAIDKGLALNFGRTPNIHDYDMTVERPRVPDDFSGALASHSIGWLDYAQLQGDIYEQLFCATAQRQPQNVRTSRAHSLAARCRDLQTRFMELDFGDNLVKEAIREAILSTDVVTYSMLTLIYRSIPAPSDAHPLTFAEECVDAARHALRLLTEAWKEIQPRDEDAWQLFVNWTIIFVPFVPFIVVFGNTIARSSRQDLALLEDAVRSIRGASQVAPAISKLRNACEKFCQIATAYLAQEAPESSRALPRDSSASTQYPPSTNADISMTGGIAYPSAADYQQLSDFPMQQGDWDGMLNEWDLGLGVENAREMTGWFEQYMQSGATSFR